MAQARKAGSEELEAKQAYWGKRIAQWRDSGLSQRVFCETQGLALSTFQWWRKRLGEGRGAQPSFLPIALTGAAPGAAAAVVQVELKSGTRLRLEGEAALRAVAALVRRVS
jgi:hypothetical protein